MDIIRIKGCPPYDGDYEIDFTRFTNRELRDVKRVSGGIVAAKLQDALKDGDNDAFLGVVYVALKRSGKWDVIVEDLLLDADNSAFDFIEDIETAEPAEGNSSPASESAGDSEQSSETESSGEDLSESSDLAAPTPLPTGAQV